MAADALPGEPGAYALTFRLDGTVTLPIATLDNPVFAAGDYLYAAAPSARAEAAPGCPAIYAPIRNRTGISTIFQPALPA